jgi:YVTN family beta-propeller protein
MLQIPRILIAAGSLLTFSLILLPAMTMVREEADRSPYAVALLPDGKRAITANATSNSISLVDLESGRVLSEVSAGKRPMDLAVSGKRVVVTNWLSDSVTVYRLEGSQLITESTTEIGDEPRGVVLSKDGRSAYIVLQGEDSVVTFDLASRRILKRETVGEEPWYAALTPDGQRLAVGNARGRTVSVLDAGALKTDYEVNLRGHNIRRLAVSPDGEWAYVPNISERGFSTTRANIDMGWVVGNRLNRVSLKEKGPREAITLDKRGLAVGDVDGVALTPNGSTIAATAAGTHELLVMRNPLPFVAYGGPGDHIEPKLLAEPGRFRRIPLGGRPLDLEITPDGRRAVVANYLLNAVQIVELDSGAVRNLDLGGPKTQSVARKGEAIFYDAQRSFNQWYSCASCHVEGHTNGSLFDTFNDGSYETPKKTLSLRGIARTGPWTWHGARPALRELVHDSMTKSMQGPEPAEEDLDALTEFVKTLEFTPPVKQNPNSVKRGEALFNAKGCNSCHAAPDYTSAAIYKVGLESERDVHQGFNPPALRGVGRRAPYLHDGSARSLNEVLATYHRPSKLTNQPDFTPQELSDVVTFLKSL